MKKLITIIASIVLLLNVQAQTLFTYGGKAVDKSEFLRMYLKNNFNKKPDMSAKALNEYIKLYSRFKMKVAEAKLAQIDTLPNISAEFTQYQKQLAQTFLTDRDVATTLSKEAYERSKKDVHVAHILVAVPNVYNVDTMVYYKKADSIYQVLQKGAKWDVTAALASEDVNSKNKGGDLGFFTALQVPYEFETVAYNLGKGKYSKPVKTIFGYHIVKKLEERPTKGYLQVAQLLVAARKSQGEEGKLAAKAKADSIYNALKNGASWSETVKSHSDDKYTANTDGEMTPFTIAEMSPEFEKVAFSMSKAGSISEPVLTEFGYHIIKFIQKLPMRTFDEMKSEIGRKSEKQGRVQTARVAFIEKIKAKNKYTPLENSLTEFINAIPENATANGQLQLSQELNLPMTNTLFKLKNRSYTQKDFFEYIMQSNNGKMFGIKDIAIKNAYKNYLEKSLLDFEEANLYTENKEYANLLDEYKDGISIFELTNQKVWGRASSDSVGLEKFYNANKSKYMWAPSFEGTAVKISDALVAKNLYDNLQSMDLEQAIAATAGNEKISTETGRMEFNKFNITDAQLQGDKFCAPLKMQDGSYVLLKATEVFAQPTPKALKDARGYAIADYQDFIEKEWISGMENKYPVVVNKSVLNAMVK